MRLYVANCTKQNRIVFFRTEIKKDAQNQRPQPAKQQAIPPGRQVIMGGPALDKEQVATIEAQLRTIGAVSEGEVGGLRGKVTPLIFSVDQPVPSKSIVRVLGINSGVLVQAGQDRRRKAAIAAGETVTDRVQDALAQQGISADVANEAKMSMEIEQLERAEGDTQGRMIEEGVILDRKAPPDKSQKNVKRRNK